MMRGLVLAGGRSSRFGSDKANALYYGVSFLRRAVSLLEALGLKPVVVTRSGADYGMGSVTVYDKLPDQGPVGGLYTALSIFKNSSFLVLTCDMPALTPAALTGLLENHEIDGGVTVYSDDLRGYRPFPGIYGPSLLAIVRERLKRRELSMKGLIDAAPLKTIIPWTGDPSVFHNVNTKEDLASQFSG